MQYVLKVHPYCGTCEQSLHSDCDITLRLMGVMLRLSVNRPMDTGYCPLGAIIYLNAMNNHAQPLPGKFLFVLGTMAGKVAGMCSLLIG